MKTLNRYINERLVLSKNNNKTTKYTLFPESKEELEKMIRDEIEKKGNECSLNHIDTSKITDMRYLFEFDGIPNSLNHFNGDISEWDVSNVTDMSCMFHNSDFNGEHSDLSNWDVSNVTNMIDMFAHSSFNGDISKWDVSKVTDMNDIFKNCPLQKHPPKWYKN
jgi:surface protein